MANEIDTSVLSGLGLLQQTETRQASSELGENAFLELIIAQMENQDPLNPMENGEFLTQLAQIQSATGIEELNSSVEGMTAALQSNQALQASSLVGRWVMVPATENFLWSEDVGMAGSIDVPDSASNVQVRISDESGQLIKTIDLGNQQEGTANYQWNGVGDDGTVYGPGEYGVEAIALIGGESEALITNAVVPVDSVLMGKVGESMKVITAGLGQVQLSAVKQIM